MNEYPYENLSDEEFEDLVIRICKEVLGIGCKTFSAGKDSAKDSWFTGKAQYFPSTTEPWEGVFCIQAKHTKVVNASCSDNGFSVNKTCTLNKEITRLKKIIEIDPFDNYLIFTNRKLSGYAYPKIVKMLQQGLGLGNAEIIGREQINTYLTDYPHIADHFGLHRFIAPLRFYESDLRDMILIFSESITEITDDAKDYIKSFAVTEKEHKNELNNLSKEYFDFMKNHSLQYFKDIESFLRDPKNDDYQKMYSNTVSDLQEVITIERANFNQFEHIIKHLCDRVISNHKQVLNDKRSIVRVFIHFMYFNCDIGRTK